MTFFHSSISYHHIQLHQFNVIALCLLNASEPSEFYQIQLTSRSIRRMAWPTQRRTQCSSIWISLPSFLPLFLCVNLFHFSRSSYTNLIWITQTLLRVHELVWLEYTILAICNRKAVACCLLLVEKCNCVCTVQFGVSVCAVWHFVKAMPKKRIEKVKLFKVTLALATNSSTLIGQ